MRLKMVKRKDDDNVFALIPTSIKIAWAGALVANLAFFGLIMWAIYRLVIHFTS